MSVDKFGRYETTVRKAALRGPPGIGFKTTAEGDYDMCSKRLRMVGEPKDVNDAVTLSYVNDTCLQLKKIDDKHVYFDADKRVIRNVKEPIEQLDVVNKAYVDKGTPKRGKAEWNFDNMRLSNVAEPKSDTDVVTKAFFTKQTPIRANTEWNFKNMRLANVAEPKLDTDGVNLSYIRSNVLNPLASFRHKALTSSDMNDMYDAKGNRIVNLADATEDNDSVNLHLLNAFREDVNEKFKDLWSKVEDELSAMAFLVAHQIQDPINRNVTPIKLKPWRRNFPHPFSDDAVTFASDTPK